MLTEKSFEWKFIDQTFVLYPEKAVFWREENTLIASDLHIGKVGHFRKAGIAIPKLLEQEELSTLSDLIYNCQPERLIFLGDLFHSDMNNDWNWLELWRGLFPNLEMVLVKGNHDVLHPDYYEAAGFKVVDTFATDTVLFVHEPFQKKKLELQNKYIFAGHIHPGIKLRGIGRQNATISCFYFGEKQAILPAFGKFTGNYCIEVDKKAKVFGIVGQKLVGF